MVINLTLMEHMVFANISELCCRCSPDLLCHTADVISRFLLLCVTREFHLIFSGDLPRVWVQLRQPETQQFHPLLTQREFFGISVNSQVCDNEALEN